MCPGQREKLKQLRIKQNDQISDTLKLTRQRTIKALDDFDSARKDIH